MFLFHDSGPDDPNRFLMFTTDEHLSFIPNAHIFCDGTFDVTPLLFTQVYTIRSMIEGRCNPLVYILLPKKTQQIYESVLRLVSDKIYAYPSSIMSDLNKLSLKHAVMCLNVLKYKVVIFI